MPDPKELYGAHDTYDYVPKDIYASLRNPIVALPRRVSTLLTVAVPFSIFWLLLSYHRLPSLPFRRSTSVTTASWHGWANVENLIVFGDSYTSTDFDPLLEQPSPSNPFGNPALPISSSVYQKWIHYLTMSYNSSAIQTYDMATYGATIDGFVRYYHEHYLPFYGINHHTGATAWNSTNTLFATFFGINDVRRCTGQLVTHHDCSEIFASLFTIYEYLLEQLYTTGARNFLMLNVPPLDRLPFSREWGHPVPPLVVSDWNKRLLALATSVTRRHPDATVFSFDTHALFNKVIDDPTSYPQTAIYKNTTAECEEYRLLVNKSEFIKKCGIRMEEYLWHDALHPTPAVHDAMASQIAQMLGAGDHVGAEIDKKGS